MRLRTSGGFLAFLDSLDLRIEAEEGSFLSDWQRS
jgi:hypothetical protein